MPGSVGDVMTPDVSCVGSTDTIVEAARQLVARGLGAMPICDGDHRLIGLFTGWDIVERVVAAGLDSRVVTVAEILCDDPPPSVEAGETLENALALMAERRLLMVPVVAGGEVIGFVARTAVVESLDGGVFERLIDTVADAP